MKFFVYSGQGICGRVRFLHGVGGIVGSGIFLMGAGALGQLFGQDRFSLDEPEVKEADSSLSRESDGGGGLPFIALLGGAEAGNMDPAPALVPGRLVFDGGGDGLSVGLGTGVTWNSNLYQSPVDETSAMVSTSDLSLSYRRGMQRSLGVFGGFDYSLAYFRYFDEELNEGREPFEHGWSGTVGVKGSQTTLTLTGTFRQNNGNSVNQALQDPETLQATSNDYSLNLNAVRKLRRTSLSASLRYQLQEFTDRSSDGDAEGQARGGELTDLTRLSGSVGWSVTPIPWPKIDLRPTLGFGWSEKRDGSTQNNLNPSLGFLYRYDSKLAFSGEAGADIRTTEDDEFGSFTRTNPTFNAGVSWQADETTSFGLSVYRATSASALRGQSSSDRTGVSVNVSKMLGRGFALSANYNFSHSQYTDAAGNEDSSTTSSSAAKDYHQAGVTLGRSFQIRPRLSLSTSLFYQITLRRGDDPLSEFDQSTAGFRLGLDF
ncbi:MAG: hypothetical protein EOP86_21270 [Verrucomicrobiaceae bacterium]|nr:MAG: hypothetical protein EOP86_21270 [Verrucomicrobiaceae bacterium]